MPPSFPDLEAAALDYAARGLAVFPLAPMSKLPLIGKRFGGRGVLDATTDQNQIRKWWDISRQANIGIACGAPSGFFVIDVDPRHGGDETLAELEQKHGPLPETVISHTGGGGQHLLFRHVEWIGNSVGKLGAGVDVRADGGYIVTPPSVHESGRSYVWDIENGIEDVAPALPPAWLVQLAGGKANGINTPAEPENWLKLALNGVDEGARNVKLASFAGHLLRRRVDPDVVLQLMLCWNRQRCRPPLDDNTIARTVENICRREAERRGGTSC
jgi:hypothetical protein